jgi:RHS repeat-associated protein
LSANDGAIKYNYTYDDTDLLTQVERVDETNPTNPNVSFKYGYDKVGNLTKADELIGTNLQVSTAYQYNERNLNTQIVQTRVGIADKQVKFSYDITGQNTKIERYLGTTLVLTTTNAYDDTFGRLTGIEQENSTGIIANSSYVFDNLNRLTSETIDGVNRQIGYDKIDQVKSVTGSNSEAYTYDANGNRTNNGYVTGVNNQLLNDSTYKYEYDGEGNRTKRTKIVGGAVDNYTWDYRNRLTGVISQDGSGAGAVTTQTVSYEYDVDNQRVSKTVNGVVEKYVIDRDQIAYVTDGSGTQTFHYLYGTNVDAVMAQDSPTGMVWSLSDRLGSVNLLTDAGGVVVNQRTFDSFGRVLSETNPSVKFRYGYTGRETDGETGLDYYRARYYDAANGRFISVDPIGFGAGDTNLYRYVGNSSTMYTDPSGEWALPASWNDNLYTADQFVAGQHEGATFNLGQSIGLATGLVTIGVATGGAGIVGGGLDTGFQLWQNQGDFSKVNLDSVAISAVGGMIGARVSGGLVKGGALVAGGAFAKTGLGLGARTAINAGVGFNVGYWGKVAENGLRGEDLTNGAWQSGAFGGIGAGAGELLPAAANGIRKGADELLNPAALTGLDDWLAAGSKDGLRRNFGAIRVNSFKNNSTVFYHGTTDGFGYNIRTNGINLDAGRPNLDFGKGFYTTQSRQHAVKRASQMAKFESGTPKVLTYRVSNSEISKLKRLQFNNSDDSWKNFSLGNRNPNLPMHDYDLVSGPVLRNISKGTAWPYPAFNQTSLHTQDAVDIFNRGLR